MSTGLKRTAALAMVCAAAGIAWRIYSGRAARPAGEGFAAAKIVNRVAVVPASARVISVKVAATGEVQPLSSVSVASKVGGRLERFRLAAGSLVDIGAPVRFGETIAVIEHTALAAAVKQAEAAVAVAHAGLERARVLRAEAEREKSRIERLHTEGAATDQQRDSAYSGADRTVAEEKLAEAQLAHAQAALEFARIQLGDATVTAPIAGVVSHKFVDEGDMVAPGVPLVQIVDIDTVKLLAAVGEQHLPKIQVGKTIVEALVDGCGGEGFTGAVYNVGVSLDAATRTAVVETRFANPSHKLKPGMFARLTLTVERRENVTVIPDSAVSCGFGEAWAFVADSNRARRRILQLGANDAGWWEVVSGVRPGELVIVRGWQGLNDGDAIEPVQGDQP